MKVKSVEPETVWSSAFQMPNVLSTKTCHKVPMGEGVIQFVMRIAASGIVASPLTVEFDMGRIGMTK
jgi:hypothetical protein